MRHQGRGDRQGLCQLTEWGGEVAGTGVSVSSRKRAGAFLLRLPLGASGGGVGPSAIFERAQSMPCVLAAFHNSPKDRCSSADAGSFLCGTFLGPMLYPCYPLRELGYL